MRGMKLRPRFSLWTLFVAITLVALAMGYLAWRSQRMQRFAAISDKACAAVGKAFQMLPDDLEWWGSPWLKMKDVKDFDKAEYNFWMAEISAVPNLRGRHEAGYYRARLTDGDQSRAEAVGLALKHFSQFLQPLGFEIIEQHQTKLSHGTRSLFIFADPEALVEADITIVDGPNAVLYISADVGAK